MPVRPLARDAGFEDVNITRLESIEAFVKNFEDKDMVWLALTAVCSQG